MLRSNMSREGHEENFLGVVKHLNLVKLVGYCAKHDERGIQRLLPRSITITTAICFRNCAHS
ncbi:hypothetical protein F8388_007563 [Cannabis sativa]|uniref:Uncharacterized protein n=1 Tax=Cannabis sativa TaxID=3483 RepID=A0A7J6ESY4_CANSA|nr:hypothetical protein F8388_007563 [Cannabis sativa]